jgi:hypothetical protein
MPNIKITDQRSKAEQSLREDFEEKLPSMIEEEIALTREAREEQLAEQIEESLRDEFEEGLGDEIACELEATRETREEQLAEELETQLREQFEEGLGEAVDDALQDELQVA